MRWESGAVGVGNAVNKEYASRNLGLNGEGDDTSSSSRCDSAETHLVGNRTCFDEIGVVSPLKFG